MITPRKTARSSATKVRPRVTIKGKANANATITIYDEIVRDADLYGFGVSAKMIQEELAALGDVSNIVVCLNSMGGDVFDGFAIYNLLKVHPATVGVEVDGIAASSASVIAMAGDTIRMAEASMLMVHEPFALTMGYAHELRETARLLDKMRGQIVDVYAARTGNTRRKVQNWVSANGGDGTWFDTDEAVQHGFADATNGNKAIAARVDGDRFKNVPSKLLVASGGPSLKVARARRRRRGREADWEIAPAMTVKPGLKRAQIPLQPRQYAQHAELLRQHAQEKWHTALGFMMPYSVHIRVIPVLGKSGDCQRVGGQYLCRITPGELEAMKGVTEHEICHAFDMMRGVTEHHGHEFRQTVNRLGRGKYSVCMSERDARCWPDNNLAE